MLRQTLLAKPYLSIATFAVGAVVMNIGCRAPQPQPTTAPTHVDRLMQTYEELQSGRFAILADFEDPNHIQLAKVISVSPSASCRINAPKDAKQPGSSALAFSFGSPDDTLTLSNEQATDWYLKRDWRGFDLLMLNIETLQPGLSLDLTIGAGQPSAKQQVHSSFHLDRGSNILRIDLAELAERIPLDDVRAMLFSVSGATSPTEVYFDDLFLAANGQDIFGDSTKNDGRLYVRTVGKRTKVGVGGRFELTFANGQIVEWFDLASDPTRLHNRVAGTTLSPTPIVLTDSEGSDKSAGSTTPVSNPWGNKLTTTQSIVEMNELRIVMQCERRYTDHPQLPPEAQPFNKWTYTVYPTGQMFVSIDTSPARIAPSATLGLSIGVTPPDSSTIELLDAPAVSQGSQHRPPPVAAMQNSDDQIEFLWLPGPSEQSSAFRLLTDESDSVQTVFIPTQPLTANTWHWATQFCFMLPPSATAENAQARAFDFATPTTPVLEQGQFNQPADQPESWGPFDRGRGQYSITPDRGRVRMTIDQREHRTFSPAFEIRDSANAEVWVYINHLIVKNTARDPAGNVIFQLPADLPKRSTIEVIVRRE